MTPLTNREHQEVIERLVRLETKIDAIVNVDDRVKEMEGTLARQRGFFKFVFITVGGATSIVIADLIAHLLHWAS
jgi:hypothetical protein